MLDTKDYSRWELFRGTADLDSEIIALHLRDELKLPAVVDGSRIVINPPPQSQLFDNIPYRQMAEALEKLLAESGTFTIYFRVSGRSGGWFSLGV